ncbi:MAG: AIR synthase-related protein [Spirochaetota bacterium]
MRTEVFYRDGSIDGRGKKLLSTLQSIYAYIRKAAIVDIYLTEGIPELNSSLAQELFSDSVAQDVRIVTKPYDLSAADGNLIPEWNVLIEIGYKAGVTNPVAVTVRKTIEAALNKKISYESIVQTARQYLFQTEAVSYDHYIRLSQALHNPLIEQAVVLTRDEWNRGTRPPALYPSRLALSPVEVMTFDFSEITDLKLMELSRQRLLALTIDEMRAVKAYFTDPGVIGGRIKAGLTHLATDVELEMIAQTWSEHCKHKIFNAEISYKAGDTIEHIKSLFATYIRQTTEELWSQKPYLKSVFHDNSGVITFDDSHLLCFKVETHNSPSALDPYGGAITGIVGVNRDILGTGKGAKPIFNTNVLCFGYPDTPEDAIPAGLLHPRRVLEGVHRGIVDGGNQSGIPVVAGAFLFDGSFTGKPLVFCGTGGILPAKINGEESWIKQINPGDKAVMAGGRIGKDGIHGATFSSLELNEESPTSAVQIGDPITQKKMMDFLLEARDRGLYNGITDNGAGGLSSSLGEMAQLSGGVKIELDKCPLKYQGLAPWEILVSESQERMSLSVPGKTLEEFMELARHRDVEATVVGEFTDTDFIEILFRQKIVGFLSLEFLHKGLPVMRLKARWTPPETRARALTVFERKPGEIKEIFLRLLSEPNIASKEQLVRRYDHEVQGLSVVKPFVGAASDAPSDGAVLKPLYDSWRGITITHGICPWYGDVDTYHMAMCAVDEAFRGHLALGGDPGFACALDNFCWPDPVESESTPDGQYKLAQLVRACKGLKEACLAYGLPLISGKDSMKNDAKIGGSKVSVRPTLLVSLLGIIPDVRQAVTTDFKAPGHLIFLVGETRGELGGTMYARVSGKSFGTCPSVETESALKCYRALYNCIRNGIISSCHDLSDGGLGIALAESMLGGRLGAEVELDNIPVVEARKMETVRLLFSETPSRFLVTLHPARLKAFKEHFNRLRCGRIGVVTSDNTLRIKRGGKEVVRMTLQELTAAWKRWER